MRNDFEHFDERLDKWAESSADKCLIDLKIAPRTAMPNVADGDILRWFDRISSTLYFRGTPFEIRSIVEAVRDVEARAASRRRSIEASAGKPRIISSTGLVIEE